MCGADDHCMGKSFIRGFTLVELVTALAIAAILIGIAAPNFDTLFKNTQSQKVAEQFRFALVSARSEAVKTASNVTVCPRVGDSQCGTDWTKGLLVFVDGSVIAGETKAQRDSDDPIIRITEPSGKDNSLTIFASDDRTAAGIYIPNFIRYGADGHADWANGTILICDSREEEHAQAINVALTGDVRTARASGDSDIVEDVFGREIDCP